MRDAIDLAAMFQAEGDAISLGSQTTHGLVELTDPEGAQGAGPRALISISAVTVMTGSLSGLAVGSVLTVRGQSWKVRQLQRIAEAGGDCTRLLGQIS